MDFIWFLIKLIIIIGALPSPTILRIENITAMNSIFDQKQSERLMLQNLNNVNRINDSSNYINNSNQTLNNLVRNDLSSSNNSENPLDVAVIIKDSKEVIDEEKKEKKIKKKKRRKRKKKNKCNKSILLIIALMVIIVVLIFGLVKTYLSISDKWILFIFICI